MNNCDKRGLAVNCDNQDVKLVQLRSQAAGPHGTNEYMGDKVQMCAACRKVNTGMFKLVTKALSASQASIVVAMRSGFKLRYMSGLDAYCWLNSAGHPRVTSSALALERAGYIERTNYEGRNAEFRFTEKGKALP